jgi:hypothetical protein
VDSPLGQLARVWRRRRAWKYEAQREAFRDALVEHWRECNRRNIKEIDRLLAEHKRWLRWAMRRTCCEAGLRAAPDPCPWHDSEGES